MKLNLPRLKAKLYQQKGSSESTVHQSVKQAGGKLTLCKKKDNSGFIWKTT